MEPSAGFKQGVNHNIFDENSKKLENVPWTLKFELKINYIKRQTVQNVASTANIFITVVARYSLSFANLNIVNNDGKLLQLLLNLIRNALAWETCIF
jgi:hypothetical protein